jgi:outer membrane protein assembly factor BamB
LNPGTRNKRHAGSSRYCFRLTLPLFAVLLLAQPALSADWPTFRHDAARSGAAEETIAPPLALEWTFRPIHPPKPAWPKPGEEVARMHADNAFHATVANGIACFGSSVDNRVYAVDTEDGEIRWAFTTEGPVRFAPSFSGGKVYFGSDDGYVYCLNAEKGSLLWKVRPGPGEEKTIGNGRIISTWPVRTSVLVDGGTAYFCAGVFPFEGIYICAVDADSGGLIWKNDTIGDRAHDLEYGGISPQSYLVASKEVLFVPSGRAMPAAFDRKTGKFLYYASPGAKRGGTWALVDGDRLVAGVDISGKSQKVSFNAKDGDGRSVAYAWYPGIDMVVARDLTFILTKNGIYAVDRKAYAKAVKTVAAATAEQGKLRKNLAALRKKREMAFENAATELEGKMEETARLLLDLDDRIRDARASSYRWKYPHLDLGCLVLAGDTIFAGGDGTVVAVDAGTGRRTWSAAIKGKACGFTPANGRLLVSSDAGPIYCFGSAREPGEPRVIATDREPYPFPDGPDREIYAAAAESIVAESGITKGYCLVVDCGAGRLACELAQRTELNIVAIEKDPATLAAARSNMERAGLLGKRVVVEPWDLETLPPYFANLVVSDGMVSTGRSSATESEILHVLRPCGGASLTCSSPTAPGGREWKSFVRGPLKGAGSWTQLYANGGNTACSMDERVKGPFGVLWYGEPGSLDLIDRHGRACGPLSADGRVFHQGEEKIIAFDAYNGTILWQREIPGAVRVRADVDGGNLALTAGGLFVAAHDKCHRLDPATGETLRTYSIPEVPGAPHRWGFVSAAGNVLIGSAATPLKMEYAAAWKDFVDKEKAAWKEKSGIDSETFALWGGTGRYKTIYDDCKARFPEPDRDLYMEFHRAGTLWQPMNDFPAWDSQRTPLGALTDRLMASDALFGLDVETGRILWIRTGEAIPNISVSIAAGTVFFVEGSPSEAERTEAFAEKKKLVAAGVYEEGAEARHVPEKKADVRIVTALDLVTGKEQWSGPIELTGCGGDKMGTAVADGILLFFGHFSNHDTRFFKGNDLTWRRVTAVDTKTADVLWSRPLNYLRRPLVVGDRIIVEPRACDLRTGTILTRPHPISGRSVPWEILRPGHCCAVTSASAHTLFYRSYWAAIYDITDDRGLSLFGAIRPGCWLNMISANGLMLMPEASAGCTCSFPLRCSLALVPRPRKKTDNWTVFVTHGPAKPVKRLAVNIGAPGDMKDREGDLWLAWPRPKVVSGIGYGNYAMQFDWTCRVAKGEGMGHFQRDHRGVSIAGTEKPWLFTSGCKGLTRIETELIDPSQGHLPGLYTVRIGFVPDADDMQGRRVFDVKIQGKPVLKRFDILRSAGAGNRAVVKRFRRIAVTDRLEIDFVPARNDSSAAAPLVSFIEIIREDVKNLHDTPDAAGARTSMSPDTTLAEADRQLAAGKRKKALAGYHAVFTGDATVRAKLAALTGMRSAASAASLPLLNRFWARKASILTGYKDVDPALLSASIETGLAIADALLAAGDRKGGREALDRMIPLLNREPAGTLRAKMAQRLGYVLDWRLLGGIPWEEGQASIADVCIAARQQKTDKPYLLGGRLLEWEEYASPSARVDLDKAIGAQDRVSAWAHATFTCAEAADVIISAGSDDGFRCWLNGKPLGGFDETRGWRLDETVLHAKGQKGENNLVLQIVDQGGAWAFSCRVTDSDGISLLR